jgi:hypothetical protein
LVKILCDPYCQIPRIVRVSRHLPISNNLFRDNPMNIIRISLATLALTLGFGLVGCEKKAPEAAAPEAAPAAEGAAPAAPAAPAEQPK